MQECTNMFLPLEITFSFFKPQKCIFFQLTSQNRTYKVFRCKYLKASANRKCDVMWGWEISTWKKECSNHLPKSHHGCNLPCIWLYVLLQKYPRFEFFIGSLLQMLKANDFDRDGCSTFIVQFPYRKMKAFLFARIISEKNCF